MPKDEITEKNNMFDNYNNEVIARVQKRQLNTKELAQAKLAKTLNLSDAFITNYFKKLNKVSKDMGFGKFEVGKRSSVSAPAIQENEDFNEVETKYLQKPQEDYYIVVSSLRSCSLLDNKAGVSEEMLNNVINIFPIKLYPATENNKYTYLISDCLENDNAVITATIDSSYSRITITIGIISIVLKKDLKNISGDTINLDEKMVQKIMTVGYISKSHSFMIPYVDVSLHAKARNEFKKYDSLFKLPSANILKLKFIDVRENIVNDYNEEHPEKTKDIPKFLPKYNSSSNNVLYDAYGYAPAYIKGEFPNAKGKLKPEDIYHYQYRVATRSEIDSLLKNPDAPSNTKKIAGTENDYLTRVIPTESKLYSKYLGKIVFTDFENNFVHYYNKEGSLVSYNIEGYQGISDNDIKYLVDDAQIDLGITIDYRESNEKWFSSHPEESLELSTLSKNILAYEMFDVLDNEKDISDIDRDSIKANAEYKKMIPGKILSKTKDYKRFMELYSLFMKETNGEVTQFGNNTIFSLVYTDIYNSGIDTNELKKNIAKREERDENIAEDPTGETPNLPHNIKNFSTKIKLRPQQALAVSMCDDKDISLLDVDMGGGKTCMMVADIMNQMTKGVVKRPLIICPDKTIAQNKKEIYEKWTDKRVNIFVLNTETYNDLTEKGKNKDALKEAVLKMPSNTIYMTSYKFVTRDNYEIAKSINIEKGKVSMGKKFPMASLLLYDLGFDMIYCDESHHIKNPNSITSNAIAALSSAKIKRLTSGTIIPNNPLDLFAQLRFLDPTLLGRKDDFINKYCCGSTTGRANSMLWKENSQKDIRHLIQKNGGVSIRRSMWRWNMPNLTEKLHYVKLTEQQQTLYNALFTSILESINNDPKLSEAYNKLKNGSEEDIDDLDEMMEDDSNTNLLALFQQFNEFLVAPGTNPIINKFKDMQLSLEEYAGPKIKKCLEILDEHFSGGFNEDGSPKNGKVLIFVQRVSTAKHIFSNLGKYQEHAVWYSAGSDKDGKQLAKFKSDPNIWVMSAVDQSIREGQNLQVATRIIRMDIQWSPGDMQQSYARAFRTGQTKDVSIDIILCDGTMEICKYARLVSKEYINSKLTSEFNVGSNSDFVPIALNVENMQKYTDAEILDKYQSMHELISSAEVKESLKYKAKYQDYEAKNISMVGSEDNIPDSKMVVTPQLKAERLTLDANGEVVIDKNIPVYDNSDIGIALTKAVPTNLKKEKEIDVDEEDFEDGDIDNNEVEDGDIEDDNINDSETKKHSKKSSKQEKQKEEKIDKKSLMDGLHIYLLDRDDDIYVMALYNKTSSKLKKLGFTTDKIKYVRQVRSVDDALSLNKKLKKLGYKTNIKKIIKEKEFARAINKKQIPNALLNLQKYYIVTSDAIEEDGSRINFVWSKMEGGIFLICDTKIPMFKKLHKIIYRKASGKQQAIEFIKRINNLMPVKNLADLENDFRLRFGAKVDFNKVVKEKPVAIKPKQEEKKEENKTSKFDNYDAMQVVFGVLMFGAKKKCLKDVYSIYKKLGGKTFINSYKKKYGFDSNYKTIKYALLHKYDEFKPLFSDDFAISLLKKTEKLWKKSEKIERYIDIASKLINEKGLNKKKKKSSVIVKTKNPIKNKEKKAMKEKNGDTKNMSPLQRFKNNMKRYADEEKPIKNKEKKNKEVEKPSKKISPLSFFKNLLRKHSK